MGYAVEQRLRFIDFCMIYYQHISRVQLVAYFGISAPQATRDLRSYQDKRPHNLVFNESDKRYEANTLFIPLFDWS